jgi:adenosylcobinamide-GDP ribazoletransferase
MEGLLTAIGMLTVIPIPWLSTRPGALGRAAAWFPVVGLLLGAALAATALAGRVVWEDRWIAASLVVGVNLLLTGGLHIDGLMDTADAFFSRKDRERMLEIMRDSRVGALGVASGIAVMLAKFCALSYLLDSRDLGRLAVIALSVALGRLGIVIAAALFPSARESGLGAAFAAEVGARPLLVAVGTSLAMAYAVWQGRGLLLLAVSAITALGHGWYWRRRLGGLTGDIYGEINEKIELAVLLVAGAMMRMG